MSSQNAPPWTTIGRHSPLAPVCAPAQLANGHYCSESDPGVFTELMEQVLTTPSALWT